MKLTTVWLLCALSVVLAIKPDIKNMVKVLPKLEIPESLSDEEVADLAPKQDWKPQGSRKSDPSAGTVNTRIIGGIEAVLGQFPWQIALFVDSSWFCGGSLIDLDWVLTAAHCVQGGSTFTITLGVVDRSVVQDGSVTMTSNVSIIHKDYKAALILNDIALIKLPSKVQVTDNIRPVNLPRNSDATQTFVNQIATVSGWGRTSDGSNAVSQKLMTVQLKVVANLVCAKHYGRRSVASTTLCCETNNGAQAVCNGDSGGPLVYPETISIWTQIGIVSFGSSAGCASGAPNAFTRLSSYLGWVSNNTGLAIRA